MKSKIRSIQPLEGVKFLSLNNRSHLEGGLDPQKLEVVDAVLRDLEVYRILREPPEIIIEVPVEVEEASEAVVVIPIEPEEIREEKRVSAKIPFLACIQYDNLESSSDILCKLIGSLQKDEGCKQHSNAIPDQNNQNDQNDHDSDTKDFPRGDLENTQAQRLMELSEWRQQLMQKLASYDVAGTVVPRDLMDEMDPRRDPRDEDPRLLELEFL